MPRYPDAHACTRFRRPPAHRADRGCGQDGDMEALRRLKTVLAPILLRRTKVEERILE